MVLEQPGRRPGPFCPMKRLIQVGEVSIKTSTLRSTFSTHRKSTFPHNGPGTGAQLRPRPSSESAPLDEGPGNGLPKTPWQGPHSALKDQNQTRVFLHVPCGWLLWGNWDAIVQIHLRLIKQRSTHVQTGPPSVPFGVEAAARLASSCCSSTFCASTCWRLGVPANRRVRRSSEPARSRDGRARGR